MGCLSSSLTAESHLKFASRRRSSAWEISDFGAAVLNAEDWANVFTVSNIIRSQGLEMDILASTFERLFNKHPKTRILFADAGIISLTEEPKVEARLRAHVREIASAINRILELKGSDPDALEPYLKEIRMLHRRIKGFQFIYFESFAHCYEHAFTNLLGSAISRQQKQAYHKFLIYLYKVLSKEDNLAPPTKDQARRSDVVPTK
ncbi:unnamed protein product [Candidula unifasciata]|uniref:Globin n=1 Tax=Candidula unifasciata TaxID=100452 RepID=A0A8S3YUK1_9EUPU|nr:unnamed protein product [Candidula unifasciata]